MSKIAKKPSGAFEEVSVAATKNRLSELLGRVSYGGATVIITRRGRPIAKLVPLEAEDDAPGLGNVAGWLDDTHPFLRAVDDIVLARRRHLPRVTRRPPRSD